jgi:hypothetical protein
METDTASACNINDNLLTLPIAYARLMMCDTYTRTRIYDCTVRIHTRTYSRYRHMLYVHTRLVQQLLYADRSAYWQHCSGTTKNVFYKKIRDEIYEYFTTATLLALSFLASHSCVPKIQPTPPSIQLSTNVR